jgi:hypothetical protein
MRLMETPEKDGISGLISDAEHLRAFLHARNVNCPLCGYNLRNQEAGRCPECGHELLLTVELTEPYLHAWIAIAFVQFGVAGVGLLFIYACIFERPLGVRGIRMIALGYLLISPIGALAICFGRRQLLRLPTAAQWTLALVALVIAVLAIVILYNPI